MMKTGGARAAGRVAGCLSALVLACGCVPVRPYRRPPAFVGHVWRESVYREKRLYYDPYSGHLDLLAHDGPHRGDMKLYQTQWGLTSIPGYCADSGDLEAAGLMRQGVPGALGGAGLLLGGLVFLVLAEDSRSGPATQPWYLAGFAGGFASGIPLVAWSNDRSILKAADHFNAFLKHDLGLDGDAGLAVSATAGVPGRAVGYGLLGAGLEWTSSYDYIHQFGESWPTYGDENPEFFLGGGMLWPDGFTLETRFDFLSRGQHGLWYDAGPSRQEPADTLSLSDLDWGLAPGYTFTLAGLSHGQRIRLFAGMQVGPGWLLGQATQGAPDGSQTGSGQLEALTVDWGPLLRLSVPTGPSWNVGVEAGYRCEKFQDIGFYGGNGTYAQAPSTLRTLAGAPAFLDFSGPFVNLVFTFGRFHP